MSKRKGTYIPEQRMKKLNVSAPLVTFNKETKNNMKKKSSKSFVPKVRASKSPTNKSSKAVSKVTSGRPGAARSIKSGSKGIDSRVLQISPAQRSSVSKKMSTTVAETPMRQNKRPTVSLNGIKKSLKKSMGY